MDDPNAIIGAVIPIVMPSMFVALGPVEVASLWLQPRPRIHQFRVNKPPRSHGWKTTELPDQHSGRF